MRERLIELRLDVIDLRRAALKEKDFASAALWRVLAVVIEQVLEAGVC